MKRLNSYKRIIRYRVRKIYWNLISSEWDNYLDQTGYGHELQEKAEYLRNQCGEIIPSAIDIGCGTGSFSFALASKGFHVTGIDYSDMMLKKALQKRERLNSANTSFFKADINNCFHFPGLFDLIVCMHTFYAIEDKELFITQAAAACNPEGRLYLVIKKKGNKSNKSLRKPSLKGRILNTIKPMLFPGGRFSMNELKEMVHMIESGCFRMIDIKESARNISLLFRKI